MKTQPSNPQERDAMILANRCLVKSIAKRFLACGLPFEDLIQEGVIGLINAVDTYDLEKGPFATHACALIYHRMRNAVAKQRNYERFVPDRLEEPLEDNEGGTLADELSAREGSPPEEAAWRAELRREVRRAVARLPRRQRQVLTLRYGLADGVPRTLEETGKCLHITRECVRQIEEAARRNLTGRLSTTWLRQAME